MNILNILIEAEVKNKVSLLKGVAVDPIGVGVCLRGVSGG